MAGKVSVRDPSDRRKLWDTLGEGFLVNPSIVLARLARGAGRKVKVDETNTAVVMWSSRP